MGRVLQAYKKLFEDLKGGTPKPLYFLYGPEAYIKREFVSELARQALAQNDTVFNHDVLYGDEFDGQVFHDQIGAFPLFAEKRLLLLKKFDALATSNKDFVIERLDNLPDSLVIVIESAKEKLDTARHKKVDKIAGAKGVSFRFDHLSEQETVERVKGRLRKEKLTIEPQAMDLLVTSVGTSLVDLLNELDKIVLSVGDKTTIGPELISEVVGRYRVENVFAFLDGLGGRQVDRVLRRVNRVIDSGEEPIFISAMLLRRVLHLLQIKSVLKQGGRRSPQAIASSLGGAVSPYFIGRMVDQAERFGHRELRTYLNNLRWVDMRLKSTALPARSVIETALVASSLGKNLALAVN